MLTMMMLAAAAATPTPLEPNGKWVVDYAAGGCSLARAYGEGDKALFVIWRTLPTGGKVQLVIERPGTDQTLRRGLATIAIGDASARASFEAFPIGEGRRMLRTMVKTALFESLPDRATMTMNLSTGTPVALTLVQAKAAFVALARCRRSLQEEWGIDPDERSRMAQRATALDNEVDWIRPSDYPLAAVYGGEIGTTAMTWTIGIDGGVHDCRTSLSSGRDQLDKAACDAITRRGRYTPAIGVDGKPMASHKTRFVKWTMASAWADDAAVRAYDAEEIRRAKEKGSAGDEDE